MAQHRCAVLDDYQRIAREIGPWDALGPDVAVDFFERHLAGDELVETLKPYDVIVAMRERTPFDVELMRQLPNLKLLITTGMRNASIDTDGARTCGIVVSGTRGSVGPAAELSWGLLLALMRNIPDEHRNFRAGGEQWQLSVGRELKTRTLGVVGLGKLGVRVAGYGKAFDMDVRAWSRSNTPERSAELGVAYAASLDELLPACDVVSLHVTLNAETQGMIGARELSRMKKGAVIVNTSRGPLIDEAALIDALRSGHLGGACLDVFDEEPLPADHPFRTLPNVVATPHLGYVTRETYEIYFADAVEDIRGWIDGTPLRVINGEGG